MNIQELITLIILILAAAYIIYLAVTKQWVKLRQLAYAFMLQAERIYQDNEGEKKFAIVFKAFYTYLPSWLRLILSEETIKAHLQKWYDAAKDYLDNGVIDTPG